MPAESLDEQSTDTNNNDINVIIPISDQERLRWTDGNDGRILGLLYEISLHYVKMGLFQEFFEHGAVATNTTTQIPSASSMSFIMGEVADPVPHDFNNPCPAPAQRVAAALAARAANGDAAFAFPTSLPPNSGFTINVLSAKKEDSKLLRSLCYVFGDAPDSDELIENAAGSGLALLAALRARASAASTADRAIVSATFDRARSDCMKGEITLTSLKSKVKAYKRARRDIAVRPDPASEVQMINVLAIQDDSISEAYELKSLANPPNTLEQAVKILSDILTRRARAEELKEATTGAQLPALAAAKLRPAAAPPQVDATLIAALLAKLGVPDPIVKKEEKKPKWLKDKEKKEKARQAKALQDSSKVKPPRDEGGRVISWIAGMDPCNTCGKNHLHRDCPDSSSPQSFNQQLKSPKSSRPARSSSPIDSISSSSGQLGVGFAAGAPAGKNELSCPSAAEERVTSQASLMALPGPTTPSTPPGLEAYILQHAPGPLAGDAARTATSRSLCTASASSSAPSTVSSTVFNETRVSSTLTSSDSISSDATSLAPRAHAWRDRVSPTPVSSARVSSVSSKVSSLLSLSAPEVPAPARRGGH